MGFCNKSSECATLRHGLLEKRKSAIGVYMFLYMFLSVQFCTSICKHVLAHAHTYMCVDMHKYFYLSCFLYYLYTCTHLLLFVEKRKSISIVMHICAHVGPDTDLARAPLMLKQRPKRVILPHAKVNVA